MLNIKNIITAGILLLSVISLSGCRSLTAPIDSEHSWTPPTQTYVDTTIKTAKIDTDNPQSLLELIDIALYNNPSTREAWANAREAEAEEKQAESQWYPQVTVSGGLTRQKQHAKGSLTNTDLLEYGPDLKITYLLLDFGGRSAEVEQAYQLLLAANFQFNQAMQDLLLNVSTAYYELFSDHSILEAEKVNVRDANTALEAAQQKFEAGLGAKPDLLQAEANYNDALYTLEDAKGQVREAKGNLAQILGVPANTEFRIVAPEKEIPTNINQKDVNQLIDKALANRADIAALRSTVQAKEAAIKAANSDLLPSLNAAAGAEKDWYKYYANKQPSDDDYSLNAGVSVDWDIFDGFYNLNQKRAAEAALKAAQAQLKELELEATADVWNSHYAYNTAVSKYKYATAYLNSAQESYNLVLESYHTGLKGILDLLDAQSDLSEARSQLIQTQKDLFVSLANLAHATGSLHSKNVSNKGDY